MLLEVNNQYTLKCIELLAVAVSCWRGEERERGGGGQRAPHNKTNVFRKLCQNVCNMLV
jgi:hypothetical protein